MATHWNPIYWDAACLVVNSGSLEEDENVEYEYNNEGELKKKDKNTDYTKIAKAIGAITSRGISVSLININTSDYGFIPDVEHNRILYGLKALSGINKAAIALIQEHRPYIGIKDFMYKVSLPKTAMISLIKSGAFDEVDQDFHNRKEIMAYYISRVCEPKAKLTLQNFNGLIQQNMIPKDLELYVRIFNFNKYLKKHKVGLYYVLDDISIAFIEKFIPETLDSTENINDCICFKQTIWDKIYKTQMDVVRAWLTGNQQELLYQYNLKLFKAMWDKYAQGTISHWEMESLCFYSHEHELANVNKRIYGLSDFCDLPTVPEVDYFFKRGKSNIPIYKLTSIIGTVIAKTDSKSSISLLTTTGVVNVKFTREYYAMFKKQISKINPDGTKTVMEKGWFTRGTKLMITGFRREDTFVGKTYKSTNSHQLYKIVNVLNDKMQVTHERWTSVDAVEEDVDEYY